MNRVVARIASSNMARQFLYGLIGLLLLFTASGIGVRVLGGLLVAIAVVLSGAEFLSRAKSRSASGVMDR